MNLSRSPYIIEVDDATQTGSKIELYLWNTGSQPASPQYTLSKLIPASNNTKTFYNLSPYVREYYNITKWQDIYNTYDVDINTDYKVNYHVDVYNLIGGTYVLNVSESETGEFMDGYSYYMDGQNKPFEETVLLSEGTYYYNHDTTLASSRPDNMAGSFDVIGNVNDKIIYTNSITGVQQPYTFTTDGIKTFARVYEPFLADGNKVEHKDGLGALLWTGYFKPQCEPKYSPVAVDFINRFGSWSRIWFMKVKKRNISVKTNEYKFNPSSLPYLPEDNGQIKEFNINGTETIKLNTGWVNDLYGEYIQEMMLSERIHLLDYEVNTDYNPVVIKTKSLEKQVGINNGMINYELEFNFAYDMINTVV
jgi:hypothetical protein